MDLPMNLRWFMAGEQVQMEPGTSHAQIKKRAGMHTVYSSVADPLNRLSTGKTERPFSLGQ
jgi:hypothetical protein